jgi:hypothetical protein
MEQKSLSDLIDHRSVESEYSKRKFLPEDALEELLVEENILEELKANDVENPEALACYIVDHARRTFAILVSCCLVAQASTLEQYQFTDNHLPIALDTDGVYSASGNYARDEPVLDWFTSWNSNKRLRPQQVKNFCKEQWPFLAKVFTQELVIEELYHDTVLPLLTYKRSNGGGGFSTLYEATIHKAHQQVIANVSPA